MSIDVKIPPAGESVTSATVGQWHKDDGETVSAGDVIVTLETDKVSQDLEAEADGVLRIKVAEGEEVEVGAVIATIEKGESGKEKEEKEEKKAAAEEEEAGKSEPAEEDKDKAPAEEKEKAEDAEPAKKEAKGDDSSKRGKAELKPLSGVSAPSSEAKKAGAKEDGERVSRRKMSPMRRKIATHLVNAQQTAAILTTFNECDMSAVMAMRKSLQESFTDKYGVKLGFMSFFVKAVVDALKAVPQVNAFIDGNEIVQNHFYDIGVAVGTPKGLLVPVLRDCERKSFARLEEDIAAYAAKARDGNIVLDDLQGGVFTISNGGVYGSLLSTPILNPPQSAILGMHTIQPRPVAIDGKVEVRPMMYLALSYDHRLIDGKEAVTFLIRIKECIEQPSRLLVGA